MIINDGLAKKEMIFKICWFLIHSNWNQILKILITNLKIKLVKMIVFHKEVYFLIFRNKNRYKIFWWLIIRIKIVKMKNKIMNKILNLKRLNIKCKKNHKYK
jgi:hypothetical protein